MGAIRISLFLSIAFFALLSVGLANATVSITSNSITTPIDYPQNAIYTIKGISGGVLPYTFNAYFTNTNTIVSGSTANNVFLGSNTFSPSATYNAIIITINSISTNSISITAYNGIQSSATTLFSNSISTTGSNTIYGAWTFNAFFVDSTTTNTISSSNTLTIDPALAFTSLTASNTLIDEGQTQVITAQVSGGAAPYTYNFMVYNSIGLVANALYTGVSATSNSFTFTQNSAWGTGPFTVNAYITDSANSPITVSNTIVYGANAPLNAPTITSPAATNTLDEGQSITITASVNGGTAPYTYTFIVSNELNPSNIIATNTVSSSSSSESFAWTTNAIGTFVANVIVTDHASTPETVNSVYSANIVVNSALLKPPAPSSSAEVDQGQVAAFDLFWPTLGGSGTVTYTWLVSYNSGGYVSATSSQCATPSGTASSGATVYCQTSASTLPGTYTYEIQFTDSATTPETTTSAPSGTATVNTAPTATSLTPSNTILDLGQYETYSVAISGGTGKFNATLTYVSGPSGATVNSVLPGNVVESLTGQSSGTLTFPSFNSFSTNGLYTFNVIATDEGATAPYVFNSASSTITVNPSLSVSISPTSNTLNANQVLSLATTVNGGTPSFTIKYTLSNNLCGSLSAASNTLSADGTNTIVFSPNTAITSQCSTTLTASVTDSASTNSIVSANSVITVYPTPKIKLSATPSNSIMYGSPFTINALISGGTGNFVVYWYLNGNSIAPTVISQNTMTSNTMALPAAGNYMYIVEANDIGTSSVYTLTPVTNTIIVAKNNTLTASSSGNPGSSYYSYPVTITFTGTPTINHQAKWSLYVNGQLYGTTNSTLTYYEVFAPPGAYNFVFNLTSDANYTPYTYTTSLLISYPPTGTYGTTTTVTTATTTVTTTSIPTTSVTTTIPPSQKAIGIASTISSSSPLVLNLPNALSSVYVYTTSTTSAPIVANIINVTQQVSSLVKPKPNYTLINAVNLSIRTTAPITLFFVEHYPCSIPSDLVVPYIFKNNTWLAIANYTVNATACTVSFNIPSDPIVAIFEKSVPTTTTTSIATTIPTTIYYPSPSPKPSSPIVVEALILIIILIAIILVLLYYYKLLHRKYHGFKR